MYEIKETSMINHLKAVRQLDELMKTLIWIDTPTTRDFVARFYNPMHDYFSKEIGKNVLMQIEKADERAEGEKG